MAREGKSLSEIEVQTLFRSRAKILCPRVRIVAVPNGGKRTQWAAMRAIKEGLSKGFPDVIAIAPGKIAFLEFKAAKGRVSIDQGEWLDLLHAYGFPVGVFRDADAAIEFLREQGFPFIDRVGL